MSYTLLKSLHVGAVGVSYTLFFLRGMWALRESPIMQLRWVKVVPHGVDSVLLASAIALAVQLNISPLQAPWLLAKIIALLVYIALGSLTLRRAQSRRARLSAWLAAQATFFYIVAVALIKNPLPWLAA